MTGPRTNYDAALARYRIGTMPRLPADLVRAILDRLPLMPVQFDVLIDPAGNVYAGTAMADAVGVAMARNPSWYVGSYTRSTSAARIAREIAMHFALTTRDAGAGFSRDALRSDRDELPPCVGTRMRDTVADMLRNPEARA